MTGPAGTGRRFLAAFGASQYTAEDLPDLPGVEADLPAVMEALRACGYRAAAPFPLLNPDEPGHVTRPLLDWLQQDHTEGDTLIVYYSGHGNDGFDAHYLLCRDSRTSPAELEETALTATRLVSLPAKSDVQHLLLIIDACYAGRGAAEALAHAVKLAVAAAPGADLRFLRSFGVLAAARAGEQAQDGTFSTALGNVLSDRTRLGNRASHLTLPELARALNAEFRRLEVDQHADWSQLCDDTIDGDQDTGFFPNPYYVPHLHNEGRDFDLAEQQTYIHALEQRASAEPHEGNGLHLPMPMRAVELRSEAALTEHFLPRGSGLQSVRDVGHFFTGRSTVLTKLAGWLRGDSDQAVRLMVVTGPPGVGKSSVLGRLVARSHPDTRDAIPQDTILVSTDVPEKIIDAAVHARHYTLTELITALAHAAGLDAATEQDLIEGLRQRRRRFVAVIDALDEAGTTAGEGARIAAFLARLTAAVPTLRVLAGTRPQLVQAITANEEHLAILDLAEPQWTLVGDLTSYAEQLLHAPHGPGSSSPLPDAFIRHIVGDIAQNAYPCTSTPV
ncbi:nSTAND1 domain-containing NTPase [Streptomyces sp. NPDC055287]